MVRSGGRLLRIASFAASLAAVAGAQNAWPADPVQKRHVRTVRAERTDELLRAWAGASEERRTAAQDVLRELRVAGTGANRRPLLGHIAVARRVLAGEDVALEGDALRELADAIDLQVAPGAFRAAEGGRGEPITVCVYRMLPSAMREDVLVELLWVSPDGEETRALGERVPASTLDAPGFSMHIRSPVAAPGLWRLVPRVSLVADPGGRRVRGAGVRVACVADFDVRARELREREPRPPHFDSWELFAARGLRLVSGVAVEDWLEHVGGGVMRTPAGELERCPEFVGLEAWRSRPAGALESGPILVLPAPWGEAPEAVLTGLRGERWAEAADRIGATLVGVGLGSEDGEAFVQGLQRLRGEGEPRKLVVVARAEVGTTLQFALLAASEPPLDAIVLCGSRAAPGKLLPAVPLLVVRAGAPVDAALPPAQEGRSFVASPTHPLFEELALPARTVDWISNGILD